MAGAWLHAAELQGEKAELEKKILGPCWGVYQKRHQYGLIQCSGMSGSCMTSASSKQSFLSWGWVAQVTEQSSTQGCWEMMVSFKNESSHWAQRMSWLDGETGGQERATWHVEVFASKCQCSTCITAFPQGKLFFCFWGRPHQLHHHHPHHCHLVHQRYLADALRKQA